jgi:hypothetical protein
MADLIRWPNLTRFGAALTIARTLDSSEPQATAIVIEDANGILNRLVEHGFERRGDFMVRYGEVKFTAKDLSNWFPGFNPQTDLMQATPAQAVFSDLLPPRGTAATSALDFTAVKTEAPAATQEPKAASPTQAAPTVAAPTSRVATAADADIDPLAKAGDGKKDLPKIEDVGEKIGGARKDFAKRPMVVGDLAGMNPLERTELVQRNNIWPAIDFKAMQAAGVPYNIAAGISHLRRSLADKPKNGTAEGYITVVSKIRDAFANVKTMEDYKNASDQVVEAYGYVRRDESTGRESRRIDDRDFYEAVGSKVPFLLVNSQPCFAAGRAVAQDYETYFARAEARANAAKRTRETREVVEVRPHLASISQDGFHDYSEGRDLTGEDFLKDFGLRGVEFGNWVDQKERRAVVKMGYNALHNLAKALDIPPTSIGIGGRLALAFGSRGLGGMKASAHYEPHRAVMNLTRMHGAGSLAHEWFHALDDLGQRVLAANHGAAPFCRTPVSAFLTDTIFSMTENGGLLQQAGARESAVADRAAVAKARNGVDESVTSAALKLSLTIQSKVNPDRIKALEEDEMHGVRNAADWLAHGASLAKKNKPTQADIIKTMLAPLMSTTKEMAAQGGFINSDTFEKASNKMLRELAGAGLSTRKFRKIADAVESNLNHAFGKAKQAQLISEGKYEWYGDTDFVASAKRLDSRRSKPYYNTPRELGARAFEAAVFDRLAEMGIVDEYLVHGVEGDRYDNHIGNPYPSGDERSVICGAVMEHVNAMTTAYAEEFAFVRGAPDYSDDAAYSAHAPS